MNTDYSKGNVIVPMPDSRHGKLVFTSGAANLTIRVDTAMSSLCKAHFHGIVPSLESDEAGTIAIRYPRFAFLRWFFATEETRIELVLNGNVPWSIEIQEGLSQTDADLRGVQLERFDVGGGVSGGRILLPEPLGEVPLRIRGGASNVHFIRPVGSAVRCSVGGGATGLEVDDQRFGAIGGESVLETGNYEASIDRFNLQVDGGASNLSVETLKSIEIAETETISRRIFNLSPAL